MAELIVTPIKLIILTHYRLSYIFNCNNLMTLQQSVAAIARQEVLSPTWGVVQILGVHKLVILDGVPSITRIDDTREPGVFYIYFPLENQCYFLTFPVKCLLQAASPHRGRVILTNLATVPEYQWVFYFDVLSSRQDGQRQQPPS